MAEIVTELESLIEIPSFTGSTDPIIFPTDGKYVLNLLKTNIQGALKRKRGRIHPN